MVTVERYLEVFEDLRRRKRWSTDRNVLRFAALTLAPIDVRDPGARLEATAKDLAKEAGIFSPLRSSIRHVVAAMLLRRKLAPRPTVRRIKETLEYFKEHKLRRGGTHPLLAALLLVLNADGKSVPKQRVARLKAIIDRWNQDHRFLTGVDDYPMAAMHAGREVDIQALGADVEEIYQALRKARFNRGNQLQLVSHLLTLSELGPRAAAMRFTRLAAALKKQGQRISISQYDEVALLALGSGRPAEIAALAIRYRDRVRAAKPRPQASLAFSLAAGLVLAEQAERAGDLGGVGTAANLRAVQALIEAQQAVMVVCMGTMVATQAATSSG